MNNKYWIRIIPASSPHLKIVLLVFFYLKSQPETQLKCRANGFVAIYSSANVLSLYLCSCHGCTLFVPYDFGLSARACAPTTLPLG
jgi:hypothetical protein